MGSVWGYLVFALKLIVLALFKLFGLGLSFHRPTFRRFLQRVAEPSGVLESNLVVEDLMEEFFSWRATKTIVGRFYMDNCIRVAALGRRAPNVPVLTMDRTEQHLLDYQRPLRPLVVNFGSST